MDDVAGIRPRRRPEADRDSWQTFVAGRGQEVFLEASARLRRTVPFDAAGWFAIDPLTMLPTIPMLLENAASGSCEIYWEYECSDTDFLLFRDLARGSRPAATLQTATGGNPARSSRFRDLLAPLGCQDELRAAFRLGTATWAVVDLLRLGGREPFTARDVARVNEIGTDVASELATLATARLRGPASSGTDDPGTALFDSSGRLCSLDEQAEQWFEELAGRNWWAVEPFVGMTSALTARARAATPGNASRPAVARLRTPGGRWLVLTASSQRSLQNRPGPTSLVVAPARSRHIAPLIVQAFSLTPREQDVTWAVARGMSNPEVAAHLALSPHTVRDHLKSVFHKTEVSSRGELVATLFADQFDPSTFHDVTAHVEW